ncbi:T9SS type A sorting domain-containing protein [bacterium SCSIO 12741]|nr:T9SS type A sorting domain-containing protein [bacterium SCSIO 12741]
MLPITAQNFRIFFTTVLLCLAATALFAQFPSVTGYSTTKLPDCHGNGAELQVTLSGALPSGYSLTINWLYSSMSRVGNVYTFKGINGVSANSNVNNVNVQADDNVVQITIGYAYILNSNQLWVSSGGNYSSCDFTTGINYIVPGASLPITISYWPKWVPGPSGSGTLPISLPPGDFECTLTDARGCPIYQGLLTSVPTGIGDLIIADNIKRKSVNNSICAGDTLWVGNQAVTAAGTYYDSVVHASACDTLVTHLVTITPRSVFDTTIYHCQGTTYTFLDGDTATVSKMDTSALSTGICNDILVVDLNVMPHHWVTVNDSICQGDWYQFPDGNSTQTAGIDTSYLISSFGCDSNIVTHLAVNPLSGTQSSASICAGKWFTFPDGDSSDVSVVHTSRLNNVFGCDSLVVTTLQVSPAFQSSRKDSICQGKVFTFPDGRRSAVAMKDTSVLSTLSGCDSIVYTELTIIPPTGQYQYHSICEGQLFTFRDGDTSSRSMVDTNLITQPGFCDHLIFDSLLVHPLSKRKDTAYTCIKTPFTFHDGFTFAFDTVYTSTLTDSKGCDSLIETTLITHDDYSVRVYDTVCQGQTYTFPDGSTGNSSTFQVSKLQSQYGCDSLVRTHLALKSVDTAVSKNNGVLIASNKSAQSYSWIDCQTGQVITGQNTSEFTVTQNGSYALVIGENGCVDTSACYVFEAVGLNEFSQNPSSGKDIRIYPNPTSGDFVVDLGSRTGTWNIRVMDSQGREVLNRTESEQPIVPIDLTLLDAGTYLIKVVGEQSTEEFKLIKR